MDGGGVWDYETFLEAIADPTHEEHDQYVEWGVRHDPEAFEAKEATDRMRDWLE